MNESCRLRQDERYGACDDDNSTFSAAEEGRVFGSAHADGYPPFGRRRGGEAEVAGRSDGASPWAQKGYKARRSDAAFALTTAAPIARFSAQTSP